MVAFYAALAEPKPVTTNTSSSSGSSYVAGNGSSSSSGSSSSNSREGAAMQLLSPEGRMAVLQLGIK